jgi:hypothetical protein
MAKNDDIISTMLLGQMSQLIIDKDELEWHKSNTMLDEQMKEDLKELIDNLDKEIYSRQVSLAERVREGKLPAVNMMLRRPNIPFRTRYRSGGGGGGNYASPED